MTVLGLIALAGFIAFWFVPQIGAVVFLPALGAYFGARQSATDGASQPPRWAWVGFFVLVAIPASIRFLFPEEALADPRGATSLVLWVYLGTLAIAFLLFGYLAYRQRVGRS